MIILFVIASILLIIVSSITPKRVQLSKYELERLCNNGDAVAEYELERKTALVDILTIQNIIESFLLAVLVIFSVNGFGVVVGITTSFVLALFYQRISTFCFIQNISTKWYETYERKIVHFTIKHDKIFRFLRKVPFDFGGTTSIASREEFEYIVSSSQNILTSNEKKIISNGLKFSTKRVRDIMTPRNVVETIGYDEIIGPLMLDDLHKTGHSRFPVVDKDIDHVVGVLHIRELLTLTDKETHTAGDAMEKVVYYIDENQSLDRALAAFLKTRHHLFVVINDYRETVGILTLEDVIENMIGRRISDEYDVNENMRAFAIDSASANNNSPNGINV